jgi:hypothetical protein
MIMSDEESQPRPTVVLIPVFLIFRANPKDESLHFEAPSRLPRSQQQKLAAVLEAFVNQHATR